MTTAPEPARSTLQRRTDALRMLESEVDAWVASADAAGAAYLIPLSFWWDGACLVFATLESSRTGRNLRRAGTARIALGATRDVVILEGDLEFIPAQDAAQELVEAHAEATGFNARDEGGYLYVRLRPRLVQAWREANELAGRTVMRDGRWLA